MPDAAEARSEAGARFLGGRLILRQPAAGHRAGTDAVLLAAAAPEDFSGLALDIGAGAGAAALALAALRPGARVGLVEDDPAAAAFAGENLAANGLAGRGCVYRADVLAPGQRRAAGLIDESADLVITNPPFYDPQRARLSPYPARRRAHAIPGSAPGATDFADYIAAWLAACLALARAGGELILIHRPDSLGAILQSLAGRAGAVVVLPVHAQRDAAAIRILVRARKGSRAPLSIAPGLVLHQGASFTPEAEAIHRGEAALRWPGSPPTPTPRHPQ